MKWIQAELLLPLSILTGSLLATHALWQDAHSTNESALLTSFDFRVREVNRLIDQRMLAYEQVLRGTRALFASSEEVGREEFHAYVNMLGLDKSYPGIEGIGFAALIPPSRKQSHEQAVRKEGYPDYRIQPEGERDVYTSIVYIEPFSGRNLRAFGYDMYSEQVRQTAMNQSRDSGSASISGKLTLVQESGSHIQTGFLMYLPVYRRNAPSDTVAQKRENLLGWVYAPFRMQDLMRGLFGEQPEDLDVEIYDDGSVTEETRMYDMSRSFHAAGAQGKMVRIFDIEVAGHQWKVAVATLPGYEQRFDNDRPQLILRGGISISLLLTLVAWLFIDDRSRALQAADQAMRLALYDVLTGLPNRKLITERLGQALTKARREKTQIALLFIDLDKFKPVNDKYGHGIGDLLLKEVAKRLQSCMRESDTAARLGGDEFIALLPSIEGKHGAMVVAGKVLQALNEPFMVAGNTLNISGCIGIALHPEHGTDEKTLFKNADTAMYVAKKRGRNGAVAYEPWMESS